MKRSLVLFAILMGVFGLTGCTVDPQLVAGGQVLVEDAKDRIIKQIGELEVKRQEVVNSVNAAKREVERLKTVETSNAVEAELLQEDIAEMKNEIADKQNEMAKLLEWIDLNEPVTLRDGSTISIEELENYADDAVKLYDGLVSTLSIKEQTLTLYEKNINTAHARWLDGRSVVADLESQLELIDAQLDALRVFEERPELLVEGGETTNVIEEAKKLTDETQRLLQKEIQIREESEQTVPNRIEEALQEQAGTSSDVSAELRERIPTSTPESQETKP